jgi:MPBQ/MSBQ methyltransferase
LEQLGFREISVEHLQNRVALSVMHIPWVTLKFLVTDVMFGN